MLAFMGFDDFDVPGFAAFLVFELYQDIDNQWYVKMAYNADPKECVFDGFEQPPHRKFNGEERWARYFKPTAKDPLFGVKMSSCFQDPSDDAKEHNLSYLSFGEFRKNLMDLRHAFRDKADWKSD